MTYATHCPLIKGYPEFPGTDLAHGTSGQGTIKAHRHLLIDGCPATAVTMEMVASQTIETTVLLVHVPKHSMTFMVGGMIPDMELADLDEEMQAILSSFHVEKVGAPTGGKR